MKYSSIWISIILLSAVAIAEIEVSKAVECRPRQVRLLFGEDYALYDITIVENTATVIFQTYGECLESLVEVNLEQGSQVLQF